MFYHLSLPSLTLAVQMASTLIDHFLRHEEGSVIIQFAPVVEASETFDAVSRRQLVRSLKRHARDSQRDTRQLLQKLNIPAKSYWIDNSLHIPKLNRSMLAVINGHVNTVAEEIRLDGKIAEIRYKNVIKIPKQSEINPHHLDQLNVKQAWTRTRGSSNVIVATIDTGVDYTHPDLVKSFTGYGWMDIVSAREKQTKPFDPHGHGTHTMGTIVGRLTGTAPGVRWMTARACTEDGCLQSDLTAAAQFVLCGGDYVKCERGANVVSNSWGATSADGMTWFRPIGIVWQRAGITAVFAAGNSGPGCGTIYSPASDRNVLSVGAVTVSNRVCSFSSRMSGVDNGDHAHVIKPDVVAPGLNVVSTWPGGGYARVSGTSMACPQVAGIMALMVSLKNSTSSPFNLMRVMKESANHTIIKPDKCCLDGKCAYGWGLVDAHMAIMSLD